MMMTGQEAGREVGGPVVGATRVYVCPRRDQLFLLPVCMRDWLEEGHLAWFVLDVVADCVGGSVVGHTSNVSPSTVTMIGRVCKLFISTSNQRSLILTLYLIDENLVVRADWLV